MKTVQEIQQELLAAFKEALAAYFKDNSDYYYTTACAFSRACAMAGVSEEEVQNATAEVRSQNK